MKLQSFKKALISFCFFLILISILPDLASSEAQYYPNPESKTVTEAGLASDGKRLITFYCFLDPEKDPWNPSMKYGGLKEWNGWTWVDLWESVGYGTNNCSDCDVAVRESVIIASHRDDSYGSTKAKHHSNYSGIWQPGTEATFYSINSPRVAFAFDVPYITFTSIGDGGSTRVYIECLYGCEGLPELHGTYRYVSGVPLDVSSASLAGDGSAFYSAFVSSYFPTDAGEGCVNVRKVTRTGDDYLGGCFYAGDLPFHTNIVLYQGYPVVAYKADGGKTLWVTQWNGTNWTNIGTDTAAPGRSFGQLRAVASGSKLFVGFEESGADQYQIVVYEFTGSDWVAHPVLVDSGSASNCTFQDLALFQGQPVAAYTKDGVLKVVNLFGMTTRGLMLPALPLLLGD
jgi:hypothetical protein